MTWPLVTRADRKSVNLYLPVDVVAVLDEIAERVGLSRSQVVGRMLETIMGRTSVYPYPIENPTQAIKRAEANILRLLSESMQPIKTESDE